jgi:hypothetical protein
MQEELVHFKGRTKNGTKLENQTLFKNYHHARYIPLLKDAGFTNGACLFYDDLEIWNDYPEGNWVKK